MKAINLIIFIILISYLLVTPVIGPATPSATSAGASSGASGKQTTEVTYFQKGYNEGFKVGYFSGYQAGKADVLSNQTSAMINISQELAGLLNPPTEIDEKSPVDWKLTIIILSAGLILSLLIVIPIYKNNDSKKLPWEGNSIRILGIVWVIIAGLVLLPVGYSEQQIAPLWAMLGTIAGYLLAKF